LKNGGLSEQKLGELKSFVKSGRVPCNKLNIICKKLNIHIALSRLRSNGKIMVENYPKNKSGENSFKIGLLENHFFIIDKEAKINAFCIKNYEKLNKLDKNNDLEINRVVRVLGYGKNGKPLLKKEDKFIDSFNLIKYILEFKLIRPIPVNDLGSTQYHSLLNDYESEELKYDEKECCDENKVIKTDREKADILFFDFETITKGNSEIYKITRDDIGNIIDRKLIIKTDDIDIINDYINDKKNYDVEHFNHTPYLMCFKWLCENKIQTLYGNSCGQSFINHLKLKNKYKLRDVDKYLKEFGGEKYEENLGKNPNENKIGEILLVAHNSRYDTTFIKDYLYNFIPLLRGNTLMNH
jgi:hypothetical protein